MGSEYGIVAEPSIAPLQAVLRPLNEGEKRWLRLASFRQNRLLLRLVPVVVLVVGLVAFGGLWGLTVLAIKADKSGHSWRVPGLFWLFIVVLISLWSYRDVRRHASTLGTKFDDALRTNAAAEIRIRSKAVLGLAANDAEVLRYAFQLPNKRIVFVARKCSGCPARFPNSDFSLVDISSKKGQIVASFTRIRGVRLKPERTISLDKSKIPAHARVICGELDRLEQLLSS